MNYPLIRGMGEQGPLTAHQTIVDLAQLIAADAVYGELPTPETAARYKAAHAGLTAQVLAR